MYGPFEFRTSLGTSILLFLAIFLELEQSDGEKDIGVLVDEHLNFSMHIQLQVNKANSIMGLNRRTYTYYKDERSFRYLFQALVRPHLEYAAAVWSPYKIRDIEKL